MYKRILVPVDGSPTSTRGLDEAIQLAKLTGASIRLVHVLDQMVFMTAMETYTIDVIGILKEAGERIMQEMKARVAASGIDVTTFVSEALPGRVCDVVAEQAKAFDADLIVLGTHGRRGVGRLLIGSDAEQIVRIASVPVLLVRATPEAGAKTGT
ncbi:MAG: universal stress protein [Burkholderiales bacterium]|nr:universal stress protein [Burkholderiales bacterium]